MQRSKLANVMVLMAAGLAAPAFGQDSVPVTPGGNDALSAYDGTSQRVRYVVDGATVLTSWGNGLVVAPVLNASRETDPLFKTLILGSCAPSPAYLGSQPFASRPFSVCSRLGVRLRLLEMTALATSRIVCVER